MLGIFTCNRIVDRVYNKLQARHAEATFPEGRLPLVITGAFLLPVTVALYGWAPHLHWPVGVLLLAVVVSQTYKLCMLSVIVLTNRLSQQLQGYSIIISIVPLLTYVTDAFGIFSASALTAVLITRCLAGTFLPLGTAALTDWAGYGWGFTVLAGVCVVLAPIPVSQTSRLHFSRP